MIAADIFVDGFFAAVAAIGFGAISDPPLRAFPSIALLAAAGHAPAFWPDDLRGTRHHHGDALRLAAHRTGKPLAWRPDLLPDHRPFDSGAAADGAGHLRLQDGLRPDHAHAAHRRERCGAAVYGCVPAQRDGHRQRRLHAGRRFDGADLTLPPPRLSLTRRRKPRKA